MKRITSKNWSLVANALRYLIPLLAYPIALFWTHKFDPTKITTKGNIVWLLDVAQAILKVGLSVAFTYWLYRTVANSIYHLVVPRKNSEDQETKRIANAIALVIFLGILTIFALLAFDFFGHAKAKAIDLATLKTLSDIETKKVGEILGTFGDFFGGVLNPILTFLTFIALTITVLMQRIQLKESGELSRLQAFEATFFNMLALHSTSVEDLRFDSTAINLMQNTLASSNQNHNSVRQISGNIRHVPFTKQNRRRTENLRRPEIRDEVQTQTKNRANRKISSVQELNKINLPNQAYIQNARAIKSTHSRQQIDLILREHLQAQLSPRDIIVEGRQVFTEILRKLDHRPTKESSAEPIKVYAEIQKAHNYVLGRYFRNLYQILDFIDRYAGKFVHEPEILELPGKRYADILRAQLSTSELLVLFYNCHAKMVDNGEFRELVKKYELLEHMSVLTVSTVQLGVPGYSFDITPMIRQYLYLDGNDEVENPGAFGENPVIEQYLMTNFGYKPIAKQATGDRQIVIETGRNN